MRIRRWALAGLVLGLASCGPVMDLPVVSAEAKAGRLVREETFPYRKWLRPGVEPDLVVIGLHGFGGATVDYQNLGSHLVKHQPGTALYAYEIRGQGSDPKAERRGDIDDPDNWSRDLLAFTRLVRERHPDARVVWFGESMGGLILSRTYRREVDAGRRPPCDALALSSPVVKIRDDFPVWKKELVRTASVVAPQARIPIDVLAGGGAVQMTSDSNHQDQSKTNPWNVESHTLRLLVTLGDMIEEMPENASRFRDPVLVLYGGRDFFTPAEDVKSFLRQVPGRTPVTRRYYPAAHHLLMYDEDKDQVIRDIGRWLNRLRRP